MSPTSHPTQPPSAPTTPYAMLLAAGLGTRLKALSDERPKPLLPVCNRPLIRWVAGLCRHHGMEELIVNLHHLGEAIRAELGDGSDLGARITYSPEAEILGTGGGIKAMAQKMPRRTCVALNAKIISDIDLDAVLALHRARGALATVVLYEVPDPDRWGALGVDETGRLCRLLHRTRGGQGARTDAMFTGVQVLEPEFIDAIPDGPCCIIRTAYTTLFEAGAPLYGHVHRGYFHEHSTPERYLQGNVNLLTGAADPPGRPGPLTGVDPSAQIHPRATLLEPLLVGPEAVIGDGAVVGPCAVIGARAEVAPGVKLERCVVWPGAAAAASARDAIFTASGRVSAQAPQAREQAL